MTGEPHHLSSDVLAAALAKSSDPLAAEALEGLGGESARMLPVWQSERGHLEAVYADRVELGRRGQGPAARRSEEYLGVLRSTAADHVDEVGWAHGEWFYVALMHDGAVLTICAVARAVWPIDDAGAAGWQAFGVGSGFKDVDLIKNALDVLGDETDPHSFRAAEADELPSGARPEADTWYVDGTSRARIVALDHRRGRLYVRADE